MRVLKRYQGKEVNSQTTPKVTLTGNKTNITPPYTANPLIGWRKTFNCSGCSSYQEVFRDTLTCCQPSQKFHNQPKPYFKKDKNWTPKNPKLEIINGHFIKQKKYSFDFRQYLKKHYKDYDFNTFGLFTHKGYDNYLKRDTNILVKTSEQCCDFKDCSNYPDKCKNPIVTYKRSNWKFKKQGAISNDTYIFNLLNMSRRYNK